MRVAVPLFQDRVSPRFLYSDRMLVARVLDGVVVSRRAIEAPDNGARGWVARLMEMDVDVFICGGADAEFLEEAATRGLRVYYNVAGKAEEVIETLARGGLRNGHGLLAGLGDNAAEIALDGSAAAATGVPDCIQCMERACLTGALCPDAASGSVEFPEDPATRKTLEVAEDVALETERKLCRVAEVVYFGVGMQYKRIGVAFCVDMYRETEMLTQLLRRFFKVTPVCCKFGGATAEASGLSDGPYNVVCNPAGLAEAMNRAGTDLNLIVGLCVGCDTIFTRHSEAPVTTVFVKDKSLANNPVGALYSKYYFNSLMQEIR